MQPGGSMEDLMAQVGAMQQQLMAAQESLATSSVTGQAGGGLEEEARQQPSARTGMQRQRLRKPLSILLLTLKPQVNAKDAQRTEPRGRKFGIEAARLAQP